jgi:hypothetical protein
MHSGQLDLSLRVSICAWCKPRAPLGEIGSLSHGICPRHLRKVKLELQGILPKRRRRVDAHSTHEESKQEALLPF